jgi:hypothetical protein
LASLSFWRRAAEALVQLLFELGFFPCEPSLSNVAVAAAHASVLDEAPAGPPLKDGGRRSLICGLFGVAADLGRGLRGDFFVAAVASSGG